MGTGLRHINILICDLESQKLQLPKVRILVSCLVSCFGHKRRVELELPCPALAPSGVQIFGISCAFPPSRWHKVGRCGCICTSFVYTNPDLLACQKCSGNLFLPVHSRALVPNKALQGMTSGLSTLPFTGEHLPWLKEPSVPAGDSTPGRNWQVLCDSTQFQKHL